MSLTLKLGLEDLGLALGLVKMLGKAVTLGLLAVKFDPVPCIDVLLDLHS